ncbi:carnitine O-palmitoyltransferase 1, muscle isoform-like [Melopsittacus undulatus]|uniref:carnitine O-palmitoyltransferase 1, muscle isoform-like n=1 Tax=Melopsittacus undulatus TaxID=13146 RepID=UPI00146EC8FC|nr:carnitine O-palmitoyltransferase 1, muscle isoform-like [Melopsittacus undulatus]
MAEAAPVAAFGASLWGRGSLAMGQDVGQGPLRCLGRELLGSVGRRLRRLRAHPAGLRTWLFLGGALGLCEAVGLDPSMGLVAAIAGGLPHSSPLPGAALALLLFTSGLWLLLGLILRLGLRLLLGGTGTAVGRAGDPPRLWMALVRMFVGRRPRLRSCQGVLPPLPLPPLPHTVHRAVSSLQALGPGGGRDQVPALAQSFLGGPGPQLQRWLRLRQWALPSYLGDLWDEQVHLGGRDPLPASGNYYLMDLPGPPPTPLQAARAANAVCALLSFRSRVSSGTLPAVLFRGSLPTCSAQYERLFNTTRVPGETCDRLQRGGGAGHVAALRGGRLFLVPVGRGLAPRALQRRFERVLRASGGGAGAGVMTSARRSAWAQVRAVLQSGGPSSAALRALEEAPFVVALDPPPGPPPNGHRDPPSDGDLDAEAKELLLGPCYNRWFDKSLTLIVFSTGRMGLNVEHSWGDPPVVGHLWEYTLATDLELGYEANGDCREGPEEEPGVPPPQHLQWNIPDECLPALGVALDTWQALEADLQVHVATFVPPPELPPPPDGLVQVALQLAVVRERGACLTYEAVPTWLFLEGRAEAARGCGRPLLELAAAMEQTNASRSLRRRLLQGALRDVLARMRAAAAGAGLDRHLHALAAVARQMRLHPPLLEEVLSQPWALAYSPAPRAEPPLLPRPLCPGGAGFAPPHPDAYGVSYAQGRGGSILFHVSCRASSPITDARRFAAQIKAALGELGELLGGGTEE